MAIAPIDWQNAISFEDYVLRLLQEGKTDTQEFKVWVRIFGKPKIDGFLKKHPENSENSNSLTAPDRRGIETESANSESGT